MKFGLLTGFLMPFTNYGDYVQSMAIEYIYQQIGIPETEIVHITMEQLPGYDGEQLLLPYNYYFTLLLDSRTGCLSLSSKITPVFLGVTLADGKFGHSIDDILSNEAIDFLKKHAPIGCRDQYTKSVVEGYGIAAYLQGCLSNALPKRKQGKHNKVLLINCPIEVKKFIPDELMQHTEAIENSGYVGDLTNEEIWQKVKRHYSYIADHASLVISSRFHIVTPCYAMGIPSIFVKRLYDHLLEDVRLDTLNPFIPIYTSESFSQINWHPKYNECLEVKETLIQLAISRINDVYKQYAGKKILNDFWKPSIERYNFEIKETQDFHLFCLKEFIEKQVPTQMAGFYIWGAKPIFCLDDKISIVEYIKKINPNLYFKGWIDTYKSGELANKPIYLSDNIVLEEDDFVVIASESAINAAKKKLSQMGINEDKFIICANEFIDL